MDEFGGISSTASVGVGDTTFMPIHTTAASSASSESQQLAAASRVDNDGDSSSNNSASALAADPTQQGPSEGNANSMMPPPPPPRQAMNRISSSETSTSMTMPRNNNNNNNNLHNSLTNNPNAALGGNNNDVEALLRQWGASSENADDVDDFVARGWASSGGGGGLNVDMSNLTISNNTTNNSAGMGVAGEVNHLERWLGSSGSFDMSNSEAPKATNNDANNNLPRAQQGADDSPPAQRHRRVASTGGDRMAITISTPTILNAKVLERGETSGTLASDAGGGSVEGIINLRSSAIHDAARITNWSLVSGESVLGGMMCANPLSLIIWFHLMQRFILFSLPKQH